MNAVAVAGFVGRTRRDLLEQLIPLARSAGDVILDVYATDFAVRGKVDASPVTEADEKAEAVILRGLAALTPDIPVVSEEAASSGCVPDIDQIFWLVDPLDGTKEFISRNGEFTVNIALIEHGVPVLGVVLAPALGRLYAGAEGVGAFVVDAAGNRTDSKVRQVPEDGLVVVSSRSHGDADALDRFLAGRKACLIGERGFVAEVLPDCRWRGRPLPASRAHDGMGHGGGPCRAARGRWTSRRFAGQRPCLRQTGLRESPLCSFGHPVRG